MTSYKVLLHFCFGPVLNQTVGSEFLTNTSERHGFDNLATAEGQARDEVIDSHLITAEEKAGKRLWPLLHLTN